jgi:hypothetical protein
MSETASGFAFTEISIVDEDGKPELILRTVESR